MVWGGEFGRSPESQGSKGRDHHNLGFTMWMAGGGIKGGQVVGATDDIGLRAVEKPYHFRDIHTTILNQLGLNQDALSYLHQGRKERLTADLSVGQVQNILNNGGFESGLMCYSEWAWSQTTNDFNSNYQFRLSSDAHSGSNSIEINCAGPDCLKAAIISDRIQTPPGQSYKLNLYTKCPAGRVGYVYIPGTSGGDTFQYLACNDAWAPNQVNFTAGPSATDFFFYVFNADRASLRIDDVVLTYADGTVPQQPVLHAGTRNVGISGQTVHVDGAPYFARGFFDVAYNDLPAAVAAGANTLNGLAVNMAANCFNTARESYLDRAYDLGLNFVPNSSTTARLGVPAVFPAAVSQFAPHLANIGWFLDDEPDFPTIPLYNIPAATLIAEYQAIKPNSTLPVMADFQRAHYSAPSVTQPYVGSVDVWMAEPYGSDFSVINTAINTFNTLSPQPIWLAQDTIDASLIVPKAYWAAISGATGIIYFNWDYFKADPPKLAAATQAFSELKQLNNVIFAANVNSQVTAPPGIGAIARSLNGAVYILAANPTSTLVQGTFLDPGLQAGTQIQVMFENRTITAQAGGFTDSFSGVSRHVYVVNSAPSTSLGATNTSKLGPLGSRVWNYNIMNTGPGAANAAQITGFTLTQSGGPACTAPPVVGTVSVSGGSAQSFPVQLGNVASASSVGVAVTINFSSCASTARFTMSMGLSANGGGTTASVPRYNQFP